MNKYAAEFLGTFLLALAVGVSLGSKFPVATPLIAGLTLGLCVYTLGGISGTHINPSITIGLLTIGGSLLLSNGVLNPAVAVGIGSISASYLLGPL